MAKTSTLTEVANFALSAIGERKDQLLTLPNGLVDDTTDNADICRQFIELTIRNVQTNFRWDELFETVTIAVPADDLTEDLRYPWGWRYTLPADYLSPQWTDEVSYEVEGGFVYCNFEDDFIFKYRRFSDDPSEWDTQLLKAVIFELEMAICMPITENAKKYQTILIEYETVQLPRLERTASYGKKYPNNRRKHTLYSDTRGTGRAGFGRWRAI